MCLLLLFGDVLVGICQYLCAIYITFLFLKKLWKNSTLKM